MDKLTVSLNDVYTYIFNITCKEEFAKFLNYHKCNYDVMEDYYPKMEDGAIIDDILAFYESNQKTVDLLMTYSAMSHLLIELKKYFKLQLFDKGQALIYDRILDSEKRLRTVFLK
jgi:hypothetical protein